MSLIQRSQFYAVLSGLVIATGVHAQVSTIDSVAVQTRATDDIPGATLVAVTNYPSVSFTEVGVSQPIPPPAFANRDLWRFSSDAASPYQFQPGDYFSASMQLTLTASPSTPRKEAGWLFNTGSAGGPIQFIVNTDAGEIVQFGGIGFYSFTANGTPLYNSGDSVTLGITYFHDSNDRNALLFSVNGVDSPVQEFPAGEGILAGSLLGGYFQIQNAPTDPSNLGSARFDNISISATPVPEPSVFALIGLGSLALLFRARRQTSL